MSDFSLGDGNEGEIILGDGGSKAVVMVDGSAIADGGGEPVMDDGSAIAEPLFNLLYYIYAPFGMIGRERIALALSDTPEGPTSTSTYTSTYTCTSASRLPPGAGRASGRSPSPLLPISGRCRVGLDGLNSSLTGQLAALEAHAAFVSSFPELASLPPIDFKYAPVYASRKETDASFPKKLFSGFTVMRVAEIVTLNAPNLDLTRGGRHATPVDFHRLLTAPPTKTVLIDVRNAYESDIGAFAPPAEAGIALLKPHVRRFDEMPAWVEANADTLGAAPTIAMYCTGGVRCERFSALVRLRFPAADVVQLSGGVQRYMEKAEETPTAMEGGSRWQGKLFVFDDRPAVALASVHASADANPHLPGVVGECARCAAPWDTYAWLRCVSCGVLILICDACVELGKGGKEGEGGGDSNANAEVKEVADADANTDALGEDNLQCRSCAAGGAPKKRDPGIPRRTRPRRLPRPDLVAAAAARRAAQLPLVVSDVDAGSAGSLEGWLGDEADEHVFLC